MAKITGSEYDATIGSLIPYKALADFLCAHVPFRDAALSLVDLACGTGRLLSAMQPYLDVSRLFGVDRNSGQLRVARARLQGVQLIQSTILDLSRLSTPSPWASAFVHCGFCFLNSLRPHERRENLAAVASLGGVAMFGLEIQNETHQKSAFTAGQWYERDLGTGILLRSRGMEQADGSRQLKLEFHRAGQVTCDESVIHPWNIDACLADCRHAGWSTVRAVPARYRAYDSSAPSHWFVFCARDSSLMACVPQETHCG